MIATARPEPTTDANARIVAALAAAYTQLRAPLRGRRPPYETAEILRVIERALSQVQDHE